MIRAALLAGLVVLAQPGAAQQGWGNLDQLLTGALLGANATLLRSWWLPDHADPAQARTALGVAFFESPGGGNSASIASGYFTRTQAGWTLAVPVTGLFGSAPREATFLPDRIELTTTMPRDGDPRCCPTGAGRWSVDRATGQVERLQ
jgi:hypothetical protein